MTPPHTFAILESAIRINQTMSQAELLLDRWRTLPPEQQQAPIDIAAELIAHPPELTPQRNLKGLWADYKIDLDEQDLRDLRQEMWQNFPREDWL